MPKSGPIIFTTQKEFEVWKYLIYLKSTLEMNYKKWENAARLEGSAYHEAYSNFSEVLKKREDQCDLDDQILYGCITAFAVGMLGSIGEKAIGLLWAKIEDTLQTAVGEAIDYKQMKPRIEASSVVIETHPFLYQNSLLIKLNDQWIKVMRHIVDVEKKLLTIDPKKRDSLMSFEEIDNKVKQRWEDDKEIHKIKLLTEPQKVSFQYLSKQFELWMWAKWIRTFISTHTPTPGSQPETDEHVEKRLVALGVAEKCDIKVNWNTHTFYNQLVNRPVNDAKLSEWAREYLNIPEKDKYYF